MKRMVYLLKDVPADLLNAVSKSALGLDLSIACQGFTLGGVRYRIYRDKEAWDQLKHYDDIKDALNGADVPLELIFAAMDKAGYDEESRQITLADIAKLKAESDTVLN